MSGSSEKTIVNLRDKYTIAGGELVRGNLRSSHLLSNLLQLPVFSAVQHKCSLPERSISVARMV